MNLTKNKVEKGVKQELRGREETINIEIDLSRNMKTMNLIEI